MVQERGRLALVFKPEGIEQELPASVRLRFAMLGANRLQAISPESHPELHGLLQQVSEKTGLPAPNAYVWESKKPMANAVAIPTNVPTIAFSKDIIELLNPQELSAVAAHELGHVKNMSQSGALYLLSAVGGAALSYLAAKPFQTRIREKFAQGRGNPALIATTFALDAGQIIAPIAAGAVASRSEELAADRHAAMALDGNAVPLVSALEKLGEFNGNSKLGSVNPIKRLISSHPSYEQRRVALGVTDDSVAEYRSQEDAPYKKFADNFAPKVETKSWEERIAASATDKDITPIQR